MLSKTLVVLIIGFLSLNAQTTPEKIKEVIIADGKIISFSDVEALVSSGRLKAIHKGVSQSQRDSLHRIYGDFIGDKEFITLIELKENINRDIPTKMGPFSIQKKSEPTFHIKIGDEAPNFKVNMIDGSQIASKHLKNKVVLLNFWATWCAPCLKEFTKIPDEILTPFKNKDFIFIPIAINETKAEVITKMKQLKKYGVNFNVGYDTLGEIWDNYAYGAIPKNIVIDKNGIIQYTSEGYNNTSLKKLQNAIKELL